jgi:tRNA A37 threonylcarbamoyladenosine modification protein TsaB
VAAPEAVTPDGLAELVARLGPDVLAVGDGAIKFKEILGPAGASVPEDDSQLHRVSALSHCRLAGDRPVAASDEIRPEYLRLPDAELTRRARSTR